MKNKIPENLATSFRIYRDTENNYSSTFFDLINGETETKQTKGLAFIFSKFPEFIFYFLENHPLIRSQIPNDLFEKLYQADTIETIAEMTSINPKRPRRRDITIKFYRESKCCFLVVIEGKGVSVDNVSGIEKQLNDYFSADLFNDTEVDHKIGVTLTKYHYEFNDKSFVSVTWTEIIELLNNYQSVNDSFIISDFLTFLTGVDKNMHYYEKEVLSIAAGDSMEFVDNHYIYVCPASKRRYSHKKSIYITFRDKNGGEMKKLFKIENVVVLNPQNKTAIESYRKQYPNIIEYHNYAIKKWGDDYEKIDHKYYLLSKDDSINLNHKPKPNRNNTGAWYYTLSELLDPNKEFVTVDKN